MTLNESQIRVVNEEFRPLSEAIRGLIARHAALTQRWAANGMDAVDDATVIDDRTDVPASTVGELKAVKAAFDALAVAATSDAQALALVNKLCVRPLTVE